MAATAAVRLRFLISVQLGVTPCAAWGAAVWFRFFALSCPVGVVRHFQGPAQLQAASWAHVTPLAPQGAQRRGGVTRPSEAAPPRRQVRQPPWLLTRPSWLCPLCAKSANLDDLVLPHCTANPCHRCGHVISWVLDRLTHSSHTHCTLHRRLPRGPSAPRSLRRLMPPQ